MTTFSRILSALLLLLSVPAAATVQNFEQVFDNGAGRLVPITFWGKAGKAKGVIMFSHGGFSSPAKYASIINHWAEAGYFVVAPLHADSTDWKGLKPEQADQISWRVADMKLAYAQLDAVTKTAQVDVKHARFVSAGHSFGGLIALLDADPRVTSIIAFSPPGPFPGITIPATAKPLLTITGTSDILPMIAPTWQAHLAAHDIATGGAYAYVGEGADHYYGGIFGRPELSGPKATAAFEEAITLTLRFLKSPAKANGFKPKAGKLLRR
jgi:dienelactone hydrolase